MTATILGGSEGDDELEGDRSLVVAGGNTPPAPPRPNLISMRLRHSSRRLLYLTGSLRARRPGYVLDALDLKRVPDTIRVVAALAEQPLRFWAGVRPALPRICP